MTSWRDRLLNRRLHVIVQTADRHHGFAMFGGWKTRHQFQRVYLGTRDPLPYRLSLHRAATADTCRDLARRFGLVVFCGGSAPPTLDDELLSVPVMINLERDTPISVDSVRSLGTSVREDLRRIRKSGFTYDVQHGDGWVDDFYDRMFRPSMRQRHGAEAIIHSRRQLRRHAQSPGAELLRVLDGEAWVAGCFNRSTGPGYRMMKIGWIPEEDLMRRSVVGAMYHFNMIRAAALGHPKIFFGPVAPFLDDGLLHYKAKWGARLSGDTHEFGHFQLLLDTSNPACHDFLRSHSMIVRGRDGELVVLSSATPNTVKVPPQLLEGLSRWYTFHNHPVAGAHDLHEELPHPLRRWVTVHALQPDRNRNMQQTDPDRQSA